MTPSTAADLKAALRGIVLRPSDLPASWKATAAQTDSSSNAANARLVRCAGGTDTSGHEQAKVDSDDFSVQTFTVSSSATRLRSKADIDADIALLKRPKFASCFKTQAIREIKTSLPKSAKLGAMSVVVHPGPVSGLSNVAGTLQVTVPVTVQGQKVTIYLDAVFITGRLVQAEVDFEGIGSPFPASIQGLLTKVVADRAARA